MVSEGALEGSKQRAVIPEALVKSELLQFTNRSSQPPLPPPPPPLI